MGLKMIVLVKQVPDTKNITGDAMKEDGTVNRAVLPAIFNPEDLNALEEALKIKDRIGGTIVVATMGPLNAINVLKDCLNRGADDAILLSDRKFAASDTLATSYALKCLIDRIGQYDLILCGRQAIDGDTAQVGPQVAEKLGINQISFVTEIIEAGDKSLTVKRSIDGGYEIVRGNYPVLLTVTGEANEPRGPKAKRLLSYKNLVSQFEEAGSDYQYPCSDFICTYIKEWNAETVNADIKKCGMSGSPTRVKKVESVVLTAHDVRRVENSDDEIGNLIQELVEEHIIG